MEIILMLSIMALIIWVAKLKTELNIEENEGRYLQVLFSQT